MASTVGMARGIRGPQEGDWTPGWNLWEYGAPWGSSPRWHCSTSP